MLKQVAKLKHGKGELLVRSAEKLRNIVKEAVAKFDLQMHGYKMYGIRRGPATLTFMQTGSYDAVAERGRWSSVKGLKTYIAEAMRSATEGQWSVLASTRVAEHARALDLSTLTREA